MKNENEKKGLFARLNESKKAKKGSGCCSFEVEEIPDEEQEKNENEKKPPKGNSSCC